MNAIYKEPEEVTRAVQQVVATAVKHAASEVFIRSDNGKTRALFRFNDQPSTAVELGCSVDAFAGGVISRGQVLRQDLSSVIALARIEFRSVCVDCETIAHSKNGLREIVLRKFLVDAPENPVFWGALPPDQVKQIRDTLNAPNGALLVSSKSNHSRNLSIRALRDSFPSTEVIPIVTQLTDELGIFERSTERTVVLGVGDDDLFTVLRRLAKFAAKKKESVNGVLAVYEVTRNCPFCMAPHEPAKELLATNSTLALPPNVTFKKGRGCTACDSTGVLGTVLFSSLLNLRSNIREIFLSEAPIERLIEVLPKERFTTLFEEALAAACRGEVQIESVLSNVPRPPAPYSISIKAGVQHEQQEGRLEFTDDYFEMAELSDRAQAPQSPMTPLVPANVSFSEERPLQGRDAFMGRKTAAPEKPVWKEPSFPTNAEMDHAPLIPAQDPNERGATKTLLIIDDNPDQRDILSRVLELAGYKIEMASCGVDGVLSAQRLMPDLVIVDFMMPGMDGGETIRRLRESPVTKQIPVLALTAHADSELEYKLLDAGADDFCPKSVSKKVLLKRVERLV